MSNHPVACLAHGKTPLDPCEKREQCARYLAFRSPTFPEGETMIGGACSLNAYQFFKEVEPK